MTLAPPSSPRLLQERRRDRKARNERLDDLVNGNEVSLCFEGDEDQYRRAALYFQREILRQVEKHTELMEQQNRLLQDIRTSNLASAPRLEGGSRKTRNPRNRKTKTKTKTKRT
jgi:hypothetical protein